MENLWKIYGESVENLRKKSVEISGKSMENLWEIYENSVEIYINFIENL